MAENDFQAIDAITQADDFKRINGIKQGNENRLHQAGILTYAQLAAMQPEAILAALGKAIGYTRKRIEDEDWAGQAKTLADEKQTAEQSMFRQHYATFTLELLLGEENEVRRTRIFHVQKDTEEIWAGWDEARLAQFIARSAQVRLEPEANPSAEAEAGAVLAPEDEPAPQPPISGAPQMRQVAIVAGEGRPRRLVAEGEPFTIHLALDLTQTQTPGADLLRYRVVASGHELKSHRRLALADLQGECSGGDLAEVDLPIQALESGTYRLEIAALVYPTGGSESDGLQALAEGGLLQVFAAEREPV